MQLNYRISWSYPVHTAIRFWFDGESTEHYSYPVKKNIIIDNKNFNLKVIVIKKIYLC